MEQRKPKIRHVEGVRKDDRHNLRTLAHGAQLINAARTYYYQKRMIPVMTYIFVHTDLGQAVAYSQHSNTVPVGSTFSSYISSQ
jgi:hypothetical protein